MGIPSYYGKFLAQAIRKAIFNGLPPFVASLAFDLNGVFHDARKRVFGGEEQDPRIQRANVNIDPVQLKLMLELEISQIILNMLAAVQTDNHRIDCLILAVDGVAPGAKMQQQRGRRERAARDASPYETFDKNAITPGTDFMIDLDNFLVSFIGKYRRYLPTKVIYSSHLVPGEGEHKIMDYYRRGEVSDGFIAQQGGAHVLYGLDADLIMLSLIAPINNIFLSREKVTDVVSIDVIKTYLMDRSNQRPSSIDDFVVMMFLIGNDFLPHTPSMEHLAETILLLLDIYSEGNYVLTREASPGHREINWDDMKRFTQAVAARENELLIALALQEVTYPSRFLQGALIQGKFYPDTFRALWYRNALGTRGPQQFTEALTQIISSYQPTDYDYFVDPDLASRQITTISEVTPERVENMAVDYMRTMAWNYLYYREGTLAINQDWAYRYYHAPLLVDLSAVMQAVGIRYDITGFAAYSGMVPFTALHQLVAVLPIKSRELLPLELQPLFHYNSIIRDFFPDDFIIELDGKTQNYDKKTGKPIPIDGTIIVPLIDRQRVIDAVAQIVFTPERAQRWLPAKDEFFLRSPEEAELMENVAFIKKRHEDFLAKQAARAERKTARQGFAQQPPRSPGGRGRGIRATTTQGEIRRAPRSPKSTQPSNRPPQSGQSFIQSPRGGRITTQPRGVQTTTQPSRGVQTTTQPRGGQGVVQRPPTTSTGIVQRPPTTLVGTGRGSVVPVTQQRASVVPVTQQRASVVPVTQQRASVVPVTQQRASVVPVTQQRASVVPVTQTTQRAPKSPAQWQQQPNLM